MRELFNTGGGHGAASSLEKLQNLVEEIRHQRPGISDKVNLHNFGYLFDDLSRDAASRLPECPETIAALKTLGSGMADPQPQTGPDSDIPSGYTYLGQFIDHDITRDAQAGKLNELITEDDFDPIFADEARHLIKNVRTATLELDSVYAGGPEEDPDLYESDRVRFKLGRNRVDQAGLPEHIQSETNRRDILRQADGRPVLGDQRNDENLLIAQTHHAFKQFHNQIAEQLKGANFARPIDTRLSTELERLPNETGLMRMLAIRNLLRGYLMSLPTGQAVAERIGVKPLSNAELLTNTSRNERNALRCSALSARTPLWYYILKESAVREQGKRLGDIGSTIVAETLVALIKRSKHSILQEASWKPDLADETGRFTMSELLTICEFEEAMPAFA